MEVITAVSSGVVAAELEKRVVVALTFADAFGRIQRRAGVERESLETAARFFVSAGRGGNAARAWLISRE
jgi:hypothetical protein